jgi:predicted thioesterase
MIVKGGLMKYLFAYHTRGRHVRAVNTGLRVGRKVDRIELIEADNAKAAIQVIDGRLRKIQQTTQCVRLDWAVAVSHKLDISKLKGWVDEYDQSPIQ